MRTLSFTISFAILLLSLTVIFSCSPRIEPTFIKGGNLIKVVELAKITNRGVILISSTDGCSMCEYFEADLIRNEDLAKELYKDYIIQRIDANRVGDKWLSRLLNTSTVPTYVFLNEDLKVKAIKVGMLGENQTMSILKLLNDGHMYIDTAYKYGKQKYISPSLLSDYLSRQFYAQYVLDQFAFGHKIDVNQNQITSSLLKNNDIDPSFYNNYLLTQYSLYINDTASAKQWADMALKDVDPASLYFNGELRVELKSLINSRYSKYDDPYIVFDKLETQLGIIDKGTTINVPLKIKNIGNKDLWIQDIFTSCGCTVVDLPDKVILPQASVEVIIKVTPENIGEFANILVVRSNAINTPIQFTIKGIAKG